MLLTELVTTVDTVTATRSRLAKVDAIAGLLVKLPAGEIVAAIGLLVGKPRQGRLGVGWSGL
ncbi:MAG TPA: ATP-dependent DNA ligase, partial [Humibacter sp.]|nr:ATP-dependent DNA ligase [Humibacter sp.]